MEISKLKVSITSTAVLLSCATIAYYFFYLKSKRKLRDATEALKYLSIHTVTEDDQCDTVVSELRRRCKSHHAIGFDCEWVTDHGKRRPVALLQLSAYDGYCGLFRLDKMEVVPDSLKELLQDKSIYKVGVAPDDDAKYLYQDHLIVLNGTLDVRHIAHLCGREAGGLAALSKSLLGVVLDKSWRVRCSDWEAAVLSDRQVQYAAADAHVAVRIFARLVDELAGSPWPFRRKTNDIWNDLNKLCGQYSDVHFKTKKRITVETACRTKDKAPVNKGMATLSHRYPHATRSKPLYHNCFLEAPDGELLCTCDNKKAMWYVEKQLADVVKQDPLTVRLRFEPAGRSVGAVGRYYQLTKENKCVVCGSTNSCIRKNVVPREYRKYFPEVMKDHSSHDVVLLCSRCHQRSNKGDQRVREQLAARAAAPLASKDCTKYTEDATGKKIRSAARALLYQSQKHVLPEERRKHLEGIILQHYPVHDEITEELLQEAAHVQVVFENTEYECHGRKVVEHFALESGGLLRLEQLWRQHFLDEMRPRHMPALWSVTHNDERSTHDSSQCISNQTNVTDETEIKKTKLFKALDGSETNEEKCRKVLEYFEEGDTNATDSVNDEHTNAHITMNNSLGQNSLELARCALKEVNTQDQETLLEHNSRLLHTAPIEKINEKPNAEIESLRYKKRAGTSGIRGQLYETKLLSLVLFRALNNKRITKFYLGTNIDEIGGLDDICFKYKSVEEPKQTMIFIQAKHRDNPNKTKMSQSDLMDSSSDFSLAKYFDSYLRIKKMFKNTNKDLMFKGNYNDVECVLVLFTPLKNSVSSKYKTIKKPHQIENILYNGGDPEDVFQINDIDLVLTATAIDNVRALGNLLKSSILENNNKLYSNLMSDDLIKKYHVVLAQKVLNVSECIKIFVCDRKTRCERIVEQWRNGKFRADFYTSEDYLLKKLKEILFEGITEQNIDNFNSDSFKFKVPVTFGNIDLHVQKSKRLKSLGNDFIKLFENTSGSNIIQINENMFQDEGMKIEKGFVRLNGGVAGLIGNLLVFDEETKMLKFNVLENLLEGNAKELLEYLLASFESTKLYNYRFDIVLKDFPTLFLEGDENDKRLAREFISKFWFFTNQPLESEIENYLKTKIESRYKLENQEKFLQIHSKAIYLSFHDKVQKWWLNQDNPEYLTTDCTFLEDAKNIITGNPKLKVLDYVVMNKIRKNKIEISENAVQNLNITNFLNEKTCHVLNIVTAETSLTVSKLEQQFVNSVEVDTTFLDFEFIMDDNYYDMVKSELNKLRDPNDDTRKKVVVFILNRKSDTNKLCDMIKSVSDDRKTIIVSEIGIRRDIESHSNQICFVEKDVIGLGDILNIENATKNWMLTFQGQETKFKEVINESSEKLIHSKILWKLINNENIEIGKPFLHSTYDKLKLNEYCIARNLVRDDKTFAVKSFQDIVDESVVVVVAEPAMGKSILLSQLALGTKNIDKENSNESTWIVNINLRDHSSEFKRWKNDKKHIDLKAAIIFLCQTSIDHKMICCRKERSSKTKKDSLNPFDIKIHNNDIHLEHCIEDETIVFQLELFINYLQNGNVIFLLDGFDEICPHYEKEVLSLIDVLTKRCHFINSNRTYSNYQRLWVTTRPYNDVKDSLKQITKAYPYKLEPLSKPNQVLYLERYMDVNLSLYGASEDEILNLRGFFDYMLHLFSEGHRPIKIVNIPLFDCYVAAVKHFYNNEFFYSYVVLDRKLEEIREKCCKTAFYLESYKQGQHLGDVSNSAKMSENPLHLYIAAEYFLMKINDIDSVPMNLDEIIAKWDVEMKSFSLMYFLEIKLKKIKMEQKKNIHYDSDDDELRILQDNFIDKHKKMALCALFDYDNLRNSNILSKAELKCVHETIKKIDFGGEDTGIVDCVIDNKPRFIHLVIAEFLAIEYICDKLKEAFAPDQTDLSNLSFQELLWHFIINIALYDSSCGLRTFFDKKLKEDSVLVDLISCEISENIVFRALLEQGINHRAGSKPTRHLFQKQTSLNLAIEGDFFNIQNYFLDCIRHCVNETNIDKLIEMVEDSMVLLVAIGADNDDFVRTLNDSVSHLGAPDKFVHMTLPYLVLFEEVSKVKVQFTDNSGFHSIIIPLTRKLRNFAILRVTYSTTILLNDGKVFWREDMLPVGIMKSNINTNQEKSYIWLPTHPDNLDNYLEALSSKSIFFKNTF